MCFLLEEVDVFDDFLLGHNPKCKGADFDTNPLWLNEISCAPWYGFHWNIAVPPAVLGLLPDSRHA
jgi:hypothetical protein